MVSNFPTYARLVNYKTIAVNAIFESESEVAQSCLTLCNPIDCGLPGSSVHGIFQAIVLEWIAISFSRSASLQTTAQLLDLTPSLEAFLEAKSRNGRSNSQSQRIDRGQNTDTSRSCNRECPFMTSCPRQYSIFSSSNSVPVLRTL